MQQHIYLTCCLLLLSLTALAQQMEKQNDTTDAHYKPLIPIDKDKLNRLKNVNLIANMQYGFNNYFDNGSYTQSKFAMNQFRLEIRGKVADHVYFRFRDRYTRDPETQSIDNISRSTDLAFIGVDVSSKVNLTFGKMCADWGGYEFDDNPINIYEYNDIVENSDNFLTGAQVSWKAFKNHQFTFQILDSRTRSFTELYDTIPGIKQTRFPAALVANWRGSLFKDHVHTLWSYSFFKEADKTWMYYAALGTEYVSPKWHVEYDFKYSQEDLDRKFIVSDIVPKSYNPYAAEDVHYLEHWLRVTYTLTPEFNLAAIGMVSDAYWLGNPDPDKNTHLRKSWGFIPSVEYFPFKDINLKFFTTFIYRDYKYTGYAKEKFGNINASASMIMLGFISPLTVF